MAPRFCWLLPDKLVDDNLGQEVNGVIKLDLDEFKIGGEARL